MQKLNQLLRQETWNILFFSGHSASTEDGQDKYQKAVTQVQ